MKATALLLALLAVPVGSTTLSRVTPPATPVEGPGLTLPAAGASAGLLQTAQPSLLLPAPAAPAAALLPVQPAPAQAAGLQAETVPTATPAAPQQRTEAALRRDNAPSAAPRTAAPASESAPAPARPEERRSENRPSARAELDAAAQVSQAVQAPSPEGGAPRAELAAGGHAQVFDTPRPRARALFDDGPPEPGSLEETLRRAEAHIRGMLDGREPTPAQRRTLFEDFLDMEEIDPRSPRGLALESKVLAGQTRTREAALAGLSPTVRDFAPTILDLSRRYGVKPSHVEALMRRERVVALMTRADGDLIERALRRLLERERLDAATARYPRNTQGNFLRELAQQVLTPSGDSWEEATRAGAFAYVWFHGGSVARALPGRDPDYAQADMTFYVEFSEGRWDIRPYFHEKRVRGADSLYLGRLKAWLSAGGIPPEHLRE